LASLSARQSLRGDKEPFDPTLGAFGKAGPLELAKLEEPFEENFEPFADGCQAVLVAPLQGAAFKRG